MSVATPSRPTRATAKRLRHTLVRLGRVLRREGPTTLTASQVSALATLEEFGAMRISTLASYESMDPSVATRVVAGLEEAGLLARTTDPEDRRASLVELSASGRRELAALWNERDQRLSALLERLTPEELAALDAAMSALERLSRGS